MRTLYTFLAASLFFLAATATAQTIKSETIKVWGNCGMCKKTIETAAKDAGATAAVWDKNTKMLAIKYDGAQTSAQKIQEKIETLINSKFDLNQLSKEAYKDYLNSYSFSSLNTFRNANKLEHEKVCFQFGHSIPLFFSLTTKYTTIFLLKKISLGLLNEFFYLHYKKNITWETEKYLFKLPLIETHN
jgi:hypothetical protein